MKRLIFLFICSLIAVSGFGREYNQAYEEKLIHDLKGIYTQEAIKTADNPTRHPVCATSIVLQARYDYPYLSSETKKVLYPLLQRPSFEPDSEYTYDSPIGHYKIHFTKTGTNAVYQPNVDNNGNGIPDYVDDLGDILDYVWAKEVDSMGYDSPPSDSWYPFYLDNGGDGKYDIYLLNLGTNYLGATYPETTNTVPPIVWTSYIELDNDYLGYQPPLHEQYEWLKVTAAHEFFHAIQFGYDATEFEVQGGSQRPYWMEMSATWMEDQVFDEINDYVYYLRSFLSKPWLSLRNFDGLHPYGACLWPIFLSEKFGDVDIVKQIWTACGTTVGDNVLPATDQILSDLYESSLSRAFREFSVWNYFTADRANHELFGFYSEGELFYDPIGPVKVTETDIHNLYPVSDSSLATQLPENLGVNYIIFQPIPDAVGGLRINFDGEVGAGWNNSLIGYLSSDVPPEDTTFQNGLGIVFDWGRFSEIAMVVARGDIDPLNFTYSYTAEYDASLGSWIPPAADKIFQNFPNPFVISDENSTTKFPLVLKTVSDVKLSIFSTSGELVWQKVWYDKIGEYTPGNFQNLLEYIPFKWDGRNTSGEYVASGIYIYQIVTGNTSEVMKMVVVNDR